VLDLIDGFSAYGVFISRDEAELLQKRYDNNGDGRLSFSEFSSIFLPMDLSTASIVESRRANIGSYPRAEIFAGLTRDYFVQLLRLHINVEAYAEKIRQRLSGRPLFNVSDAFSAVDNNHTSFITKAWHTSQ